MIEVAIELIRLNKRLADITEALPMPPDVDDMHENITPDTVAVNLHGIVPERGDTDETGANPSPLVQEVTRR